MNKRKLVLLSLILPVLVSGSAQANPWKNTLKKAGYAGAAVIALYTGYQAAKAYGFFGQSEQAAPAPVAPIQNQPGVKSAQQLLEENQIKLIDARLAQRAASKEAAAQQAKAQEEAKANRALGQQLQEEREIAANQKAHYERNVTTQRGLLEARDMELRKLRASTAGQEIELQQLRQRLDEAYKAQASTPTLPVVIQEPAAAVVTINYKQLYADILQHQKELSAAEQAFTRIKPHIESNNTHVFTPFAETETLIASALVAANTFTQDIKFEDLAINIQAVEYAQQALEVLKLASKKVYDSFNGIRRELQRINDSYSTYGWNYKTKGKISSDIQMFDEFVSAFSRLIHQ